MPQRRSMRIRSRAGWCGFWTLPPEIRLAVYGLVFDTQFRPHTINVGNHVYLAAQEPFPNAYNHRWLSDGRPKVCPSLLLVCHDMYGEARAALLDQTEFDIVCWDPVTISEPKQEGAFMGALEGNEFLTQVRKASILGAKGPAEDFESTKKQYECLLSELQFCRHMTSLKLSFCADTLTDDEMEAILDIFMAVECNNRVSVEMQRLRNRPYRGFSFGKLLQALKPTYVDYKPWAGGVLPSDSSSHPQLLPTRA